MKMNLALITSRYPKENAPYNHMFVHVRALYFKTRNVSVTVFVPSKKNANYIYQGIRVLEMKAKDIVHELHQFDCIYLHLLNHYPLANGGFSIYRALERRDCSTAIYLHGADVLTNSNEFTGYTGGGKEFLKKIYATTWKRYFMGRLLRVFMERKDCLIVTPSRWLLEQVSTMYHIEPCRINVIPNGIDTTLFSRAGGFSKRHRILCLRPLNHTYPIELCVRLMLFLPEEFTLDIYGEGEDYEKILQLILSLNLQDRVFIYKGFVRREDLPTLFEQYGVFNAFSKLDTQGVIMCEALSSGLLVLSSNRTAIPEFVQDGVSGLLHNEVEDLRSFGLRLIAITSDELSFKKMTLEARESMLKINWELQGEKELDLLMSAKN